MSEYRQTPSQTVGPFFHYALMKDGVDDLDPAGEAGEPIVVTGAVFDGAGDLVDDAMVEIWQSDGGGRYRHPADGRSGDVPSSFIGFGRVASTDGGTYRVRTAMPGTIPGRDGAVQAPHLNVHVFARGVLDKLATRIYFEGVEANAHDPVLGSVPPERRATLLARLDGQEAGTRRYRFDIVLQGTAETVFFDA
ncbi:protocatechuate 3,4-dioxygenase subunit alpha [Nitriliruptor alkaliphilus]|uniref:protocatechuate 3,4-dioxygenase subunit alpha n=1 Tax=Nitriliruptor alkaliphilus TaxID=427918 RepID=UPI000ADF767D|nr:protocatechuate 3,4-dioxygenase subunit alpha [Nitriliruptor alkaliphilus]